MVKNEKATSATWKHIVAMEMASANSHKPVHSWSKNFNAMETTENLYSTSKLTASALIAGCDSQSVH